MSGCVLLLQLGTTHRLGSQRTNSDFRLLASEISTIARKGQPLLETRIHDTWCAILGQSEDVYSFQRLHPVSSLITQNESAVHWDGSNTSTYGGEVFILPASNAVRGFHHMSLKSSF